MSNQLEILYLKHNKLVSVPDSVKSRAPFKTAYSHSLAGNPWNIDSYLLETYCENHPNKKASIICHICRKIICSKCSYFVPLSKERKVFYTNRGPGQLPREDVKYEWVGEQCCAKCFLDWGVKGYPEELKAKRGYNKNIKKAKKEIEM